MTQQYGCAYGCDTPLTVADNLNNGLVTVNVDGHAKPAHRECPTKGAETPAAVLDGADAAPYLPDRDSERQRDAEAYLPPLLFNAKEHLPARQAWESVETYR